MRFKCLRYLISIPQTLDKTLLLVNSNCGTCFSSYNISYSFSLFPLCFVWNSSFPALTYNCRHKLVFFAGRVQNSHIRQELISVWENDTDMDIFSRSAPFPYEEGLRKSKYCLHVKGYEVNTARVCDAIHYGCIPVIVSNYYDLPFSNVLDWGKFSVIISHKNIVMLKNILLSISKLKYLSMYQNLRLVKRHFEWHTTPRGYDSFHMTAYQLWLRRGVYKPSYQF